jgi:hypothetical protein
MKPLVKFLECSRIIDASHRMFFFDHVNILHVVAG